MRLELTYSRLTLGLMGLDELHLRVLAASSDNPKERRNATKGAFHRVPGIITQCLQFSNSWAKVATGFSSFVPFYSLARHSLEFYLGSFAW